MRKTQPRQHTRNSSRSSSPQVRAEKPDRAGGKSRSAGKKTATKPTGNVHSRKPSPKTGSKSRTKQTRGEFVDAPKPKRPTQPAGPAVNEPMRIAKAMARAGLCSRREAERWIEDGRVKLNGKRLTTPAVEVGPKDRVLVDNQPLPMAEPTRLWRFHKPRGHVTTNNDPEGRPTVFDQLPADLPRVISVGRLDFNTEGLLLLTNDGALARHLELPATGWLRRYRVRAHGRVSQKSLDQLKDGITIDGVRYGPIEATLDSQTGANSWLTIGLREGKNREVRRILSSLDLDVNRLIRVSYGPIQLLDLKPGRAEVVRRKVLIDQLSNAVAEELGITAGATDEAPDKPWQTNKQKAGPARSSSRASKPTGKTPSKPATRNQPAKKRTTAKNKTGKNT